MGDENESLLRKALVTIESSNIDQMIDKSKNSHDYFTYEVCTINIDSKLNWQLMDGIISYVFKRYLQKIDPTQCLGLNKNSIEKYHIGEIVRKINDTRLPDLLPFGYLVGNNCTIRILLKGKLMIKMININILNINFIIYLKIISIIWTL